MYYVVIMAGGQGTRLWPKSRKSSPKQLQSLVSERSLIQETYDRLLPSVPASNIIISTTPEYHEEMKKQLPQIPEENFIIEPFANGNAAACGLVTSIMMKRDSEASLAFLASDHSIKDPGTFLKIVDYTKELIEKHPNFIMTIGITPTRPDTGLGYIEMDKKLEEKEGLSAYQVARFVEKPSLEKAEEYVKSGKYLWNSGMFVWKAKHFLGLMEKYMPDSYAILDKICQAYGTDEYEKVLLNDYGKTENTTVDYGIMEKTNEIMVIPGDFGWSDVGSWSTLYELLAEMESAPVISRGHHVGHGDNNCLVLAGDKLIATVGLEDAVVIDTDDAILICNRHKSHQIKDLLKKLKAEGKEAYL